MFRPFLPCGIAYGFAYALPMALPMAFHALFPAEGIPPGCLYCTISARCLSTGFGRISAAFAFFRRRGVPPCRGGLLRRCRRGGRWRRPTGLNPSGTCSPCPGGEDHLKRRRRLRRIVPSPPVPPLLGCRHCSRESISCHSGGKPWTSLCAGYLLDSLCKCRAGLGAGMQGAQPLA